MNLPYSPSFPSRSRSPNGTHHQAITTGLSGNEMFCLNLKGYSAGNLVIGNSVHSLGVIGGIASGLKTLAGGEIRQMTELIQMGRNRSFHKLWDEAKQYGGTGVTGVTSEIVFHAGNIEFLSVGSCVHRQKDEKESLAFSTSSDGQELYCQLDCGFEPRRFVFGNVAYSIGLGGGLTGALRSLGRGEVKEYSDIFAQTRHLALSRIKADAVRAGGNAVLGIETTIMPFQGAQEMLMIGTASHHAQLQSFNNNPITSDLTNEEMWNIIHMGYMPQELVMGVSVYSLGFVGGVATAFQSLGKGEIESLSSLIYEARENAIQKVHQDALRSGADDVVGIKTYVYDLGGGLIEFIAMGTAVKKVEGVTTLSPHLPPQAVMVDRDTFINATENSVGVQLNRGTGRPLKAGAKGPLFSIVLIVVFVLIRLWLRNGLH